MTGIDLKHLDLAAESVQVTGKGFRVGAAYFGSKTTLALATIWGAAIATLAHTA